MMSFLTRKITALDVTAGGAAHWSGHTRAIPDAYRETMAGFDPYKAGVLAARTAGPDGPILDNPALIPIGTTERNQDQLEGKADSVFLEAQHGLQQELQGINENAAKAEAETNIKAAQHAAEEQSKPAVEKLNNAHGELNEFYKDEPVGPLGENDYDIEGSLQKQLRALLLILVLDALLNGFAYIPVMAQGVLQALAISTASSAAMAGLGAAFGAGLRFWRCRRKHLKFWRVVVVGAAAIAVIAALGLAQYRAVLEAIASNDDAVPPSILTATPSIVGLPIFVGCLVVFVFAAVKFRGGPGSPWATFADHAYFDRNVRLASARHEAIKANLFENITHIIADTINVFRDENAAERERLKAAKIACDQAKLHIKDMENSHFAMVWLAERDIGLIHAGILSVRKDLGLDDLPPALFRKPAFPDVAELDQAMARAEAAYAERTEQLASFEKELGAMAEAALKDFSKFGARSHSIGEAKRQENTKITRSRIEGVGGQS